jgi:predicted PurR-regulated permease PerM
MNSNEPVIERRKHSALDVRHLTAPRLLVLGALGALLYIGHVAFIPIALALLFALVLSSPVEGLYKHGVPRGIGALVMLAVAQALLIAAIALLWKPAQY